MTTTITTLNGAATTSGVPEIQITVQEAIAQVALEVGAVEKDSLMESGQTRYRYRSIDNLLSAVHDPLARNSVTFSPDHIQIVSEEKGSTRSGSTQYFVRAIVTYRVYGPAGDYISASVLSEALDTSDKSSSKLMSQAYKYAIAQVLSIPFAMEEQDADRPEPIEPKQEEIPLDQDAILASIAASAKSLGKTVTEVTNKVREQNGGLGPDELFEISLPTLQGFATQLAGYAQRNRSK